MLIMKKLGIQADSGLYVHIWALKLHVRFNVDKKLSWLNFVRIIYFESLITFHQQKYNIPGTIL